MPRSLHAFELLVPQRRLCSAPGRTSLSRQQAGPARTSSPAPPARPCQTREDWLVSSPMFGALGSLVCRDPGPRRDSACTPVIPQLVARLTPSSSVLPRRSFRSRPPLGPSSTVRHEQQPAVSTRALSARHAPPVARSHKVAIACASWSTSVRPSSPSSARSTSVSHGTFPAARRTNCSPHVPTPHSHAPAPLGGLRHGALPVTRRRALCATSGPLQVLLHTRKGPSLSTTHAMLALTTYARCSADEGYYETMRGGLVRAKRATDGAWSGERVFDEASVFDGGDARRAFVKESARKGFASQVGLCTCASGFRARADTPAMPSARLEWTDASDYRCACRLCSGAKGTAR